MNNGNKISELENELKLKQNEVSKLKNAKMKLLCLLIICTFLIPFIPLKKGSLNDQYGYWGGVLFTSVITFGITPLVYFLVLENEEKAVTELKRKIDLERRLNELKKDDND